MAKAGRPPKNAAMDSLDATLRGEIEEALKSNADESVASIYRRFGLSQRGILLRTFHNFATAVRARLSPAQREADERVPEWDEIDKWARIEALAQLRAGNAKLYELVLLSRSRRESDKLALEQQAEKRATELHELKLKDLRTRFKAEVEAKTEGGKTLGREDVYDLIDKAMRGEQL